MQAGLLRALDERRPEIRARWEALLRIERIATPLANPDTLIYLFDWTLDEIFAALRAPEWAKPSADEACRACECGGNPFVAYFIAGKQALIEALVWAQAETPNLDPQGRDGAAADLRAVLEGIGRREILSFCTLCRHRVGAVSSVVGADP